jgi:hypothetical protein
VNEYDKLFSAVDVEQLPTNVEVGVLQGQATKLVGNDQANLLIGNAQNALLAGAGGNDSILSKGGRDTIIGGTGDDLIRTDFHAGVVMFKPGDGQDSLLAASATELHFEGIQRGDVSAVRDGFFVQLSMGAQDGVRIQDFWYSNYANIAAMPVTFTDGETCLLDDLFATPTNLTFDNTDGGYGPLQGANGNDTFVARINDTLIGGHGSDTYVLGPNGPYLIVENGRTEDTDTVVFKADVDTEQLWFGYAAGSSGGTTLTDLVIKAGADSHELLRVQDWLAGATPKIDAFTDPTGAHVLSASEVNALVEAMAPFTAAQLQAGAPAELKQTIVQLWQPVAPQAS